jgi:hypothetical protein
MEEGRTLMKEIVPNAMYGSLQRYVFVTCCRPLCYQTVASQPQGGIVACGLGLQETGGKQALSCSLQVEP